MLNNKNRSSRNILGGIVIFTGLSFFSFNCSFDGGDSEGDGNESNTSHNAGANCLASGCHDTSNPGHSFTIAGTVYQADGTTPSAGTTVTVSSATDTINLVTDASGNFYTSDSRFSSGMMTSAMAGGSMSSSTNFPSGCNSCHGTSTAVIY